MDNYYIIMRVLLIALFVFTDSFVLIGFLIKYIWVNYGDLCSLFSFIYSICKDRKEKE